MDDFSISVHTLILHTQIHTHINYVSKFTHCRVKSARAVVIAATRVAAINPLNAELNPIGHLLALLEAHHILHVSRIRVKDAGDF
jgi:hypothetical protein